MELKVQRFEDHILGNCRIILECHRELTKVLEGFAPGQAGRANTDRSLVRMSVASQKVLDLVAPHPSSGEIHGLPKEATLYGNEPDVLIVDRENPSWDFRPWFTEKATVIRESLNELMANLEIGPDDEEHLSLVRRRVRTNMAEIENKAEAILEMIESGRLNITDVKLEDDE